MKNSLDKGLIIQMVLVVILIVLMILAIFNSVFLPFADFIAGVIFITMVYNKNKDYSMFMKILLILFGILFMGLGVFNIVHG